MELGDSDSNSLEGSLDSSDDESYDVEEESSEVEFDAYEGSSVEFIPYPKFISPMSNSLLVICAALAVTVIQKNISLVAFNSLMSVLLVSKKSIIHYILIVHMY